MLDYRDLGELGSFDVVASIGMFEHVGRANIGPYFRAAFGALRPGGLFLNHAIAATTDERSNPRGGVVDRYVFPSTARVYPSFLQGRDDVGPRREVDAIPGDPEKGYGEEKMFAGQLTSYYHEDYDLDVRIVRFHNIYGPLGTYDGGREKAPAAICRKVAEAADGSPIEVWGDGEQTRSDC